MPAMTYRLRWPDASEMSCYSPSLIIRDLFEPGAAYALDDFLPRIRQATRIGSDRVAAKFGFACSAAADQLAQIEAKAQGWPADAVVLMVGFDT